MTRMKAISVRHPWAYLIASGRKTVEVRKWFTHHRGPLLICSSKQKWDKDYTPLICPKSLVEEIDRNVLLYGAALCIVDVKDCCAMRTQWIDQACLDGGGYWAWVLENLRTIRPFPVKGQQGFFYVDVPKRALLGGVLR